MKTDNKTDAAAEDAKDSHLALKKAYQKAVEDLRAAYAVATDAAHAEAFAAYDKARAALEAYQAQQSPTLDANLAKL